MIFPENARNMYVFVYNIWLVSLLFTHKDAYNIQSRKPYESPYKFGRKGIAHYFSYHFIPIVLSQIPNEVNYNWSSLVDSSGVVHMYTVQ